MSNVLNAKIIAKCDPITKCGSDGQTWLVGYQRRGSSRSPKKGKQYWLHSQKLMAPAMSMQCVDCAHAPHNLTGEALSKFTFETRPTDPFAWCPLHRDYQSERCTTHERFISQPEPK